jgi:hypothetical protein
MEYNITDIINTLLGVDENNQPLSAPDGVIDRSRIAEILGMITQEGRAFKSDEPAAITRAIGALLKRAIVDKDSEDVLNVLLALSMMPTLIVRAVQEICPTVCPEEIFMIAFDQCQIEWLRRDLQSTPYFQMADGRMVYDVHAHHLLAAPFIIDEAVKHHFVRRHITPAHYAAHEAPVAQSAEPESHDESEFEILDDSEVTDEAPPETPKSRKVRLSDLGRLSADPLEGFDEFHDYFRAHDHKLWEAGLDLHELPRFGEEFDPDA